MQPKVHLLNFLAHPDYLVLLGISVHQWVVLEEIHFEHISFGTEVFVVGPLSLTTILLKRQSGLKISFLALANPCYHNS